jgi:hypothetical protein
MYLWLRVPITQLYTAICSYIDSIKYYQKRDEDFVSSRETFREKLRKDLGFSQSVMIEARREPR